MNLNKLYLTENACYKAGEKIKVKGIMVHSTGANNPYIKRYVGPNDGKLGENRYGNHWNTMYPGGSEVCVHAFIGKLENESVAAYQTLPWDYRGWHAGGDANNTHIGFEICEDDLTDGNYFEKVYQEAVELCVYLCKKYGLTEKNIICHSEGADQGIASDHADVMHWFPKHGKSMDTFRADVKKLLNGAETKPEEKQMYRVRKTWADAKSQIGAYSILENAKNACPSGYKVFDSDGDVVYTPETGKDEDEVKVAMIGNGDSGNTVKAAQAILEAFGYSCGGYGADGIFGDGTESAVKRFQRNNGLSADGIIGPDTWNALLN